MAKKKKQELMKSCSDCIHEDACRIWTNGRMISDESASRCPEHTTVRESAAYLIGKLEAERKDEQMETVIEYAEKRLKTCEDYDKAYWAAYLDGARAQKREFEKCGAGENGVTPDIYDKCGVGENGVFPDTDVYVRSEI